MIVKSLAIIGAGFSGACLAFFLKNNFDITVFEKARGVGGRLSVRYTDDFSFDFGAPYFEISNPDFLNFVKNNLPAACMNDNWVAVPKMNSLVKPLLENIPLSLATKVTSLAFKESKWTLYQDEQLLGCYDYCVLAIPPEQAQLLVKNKIDLTSYSLDPQFVLMLGGSNLNLKDLKNSFYIERIVANHLKPERHTKPSWVIYMKKDWSLEYLESEPIVIEQKILSLLEQDFKLDVNKIEYKSLHRWRYATTQKKHNTGFIWDSSLKLGVIGDFLLNSDVESAYLSAKLLSECFL